MSAARTLLVLAVLLAAACARHLEEGPERLASFDVVIDFDAQPSPGDPLALCPCPFPGCEGQDLCPGAPGRFEAELPFPGQRWTTVPIDVVAVGSKGTRPFPVDIQVSVSLARGQLFGASRQVRLVGGKADDVLVRLRRTPGVTNIWVEDNLPREDGLEPTYVAGATAAPLLFAQPRIEDIQRTDDECCNSLQGQRVSITEGRMYVTRTTGSGFHVQDVNSLSWNGLFVFAFNGIEGLRAGSRLLELDGAVTEFQSSTQLTEPTYVPLNGLCGAPRALPEGGRDIDQEVGDSAARSRCPRGAECKKDEAGVDRCTPDGDPSLDPYGRRVCVVGNDGSCPFGMECRDIQGLGSFCQVRPLPMTPVAFPIAPFCGPINTANDLSVEALEGTLVKITGTGTRGVRPEGLPVCRAPEGDDPLSRVRSSCRPQDVVDGQLAVDCSIATNGEPLLRDEDGTVCLRGNQACTDDGRPFTALRSSCLDTGDPGTPRCVLGQPGEPLLTNTGSDINDDTRICRNTLDDFLTSGFQSFAQSKVFFEDEEGRSRCATVSFEALTNFDVLDAQERGVAWRSITGTLRQVRFRSTTSYWIVDVRFPEDLEPL
jgi:hypothetical protein